MPIFDKSVMQQIESVLKEVNIKLYLERSDEQVTTVLNCINDMPEIEKEIMTRKYIDVEAEYTTHKMVYEPMGFNKSQYIAHRNSALEKLAIKLGLLEEVL
ncbi:hypothetical protein D3C77_620720 [compost metagenome]